MLRQLMTLAAAVAAGLAAGCGSGTPKEELIHIKPADPMVQVKATLDNYVKGQPLGSEVTGYPALVGSVRKVDPAKADILEKGLADIEKGKGNPAPKAKALLAALGLDQPK